MSDQDQSTMDAGPEAVADPIDAAVAGADDALDAMDVGHDDDGYDEGETLATPPEGDALPESDDPAGDRLESEGEEGEADEELGEDEVAIELPDALKEQGFEDLIVAKEQEDLFRALINDFHGRAGLEEREEKFLDYESQLFAELDEFRLVAATDPFKVLEQTFGENTDAAEETFRLWLLEDPKRWGRHAKWLEKLQDDDALVTEQRELRLNHRERVDEARKGIETARKSRQAAVAVRSRVSEIIESIGEADREFVSERLKADIQAAARRKAEKGESDILTVKEVEKLALPWIERFGADRRKDAAGGETPHDQRVAEAQKKMKARALARKRASKTVTGGDAPPLGFQRPRKGTTLDAVLDNLTKSGGP